MDFQLLGPFTARHDGRPVPLGLRRQERCLLAVLLLEPGRAVTTERLIDLLWDASPPASARATVHTYVRRLRAAVEPYGVRVATRHDGYAVEPETCSTDARRFTELAAEAAAAGDPAQRVGLYDDALALWQGPLLADAADDRLRTRLGAELTELRLSLTEHRAQARLDMGADERVVADLTPVVSDHPTREVLVAALMTALYRTGRQAEALRLYDRTRRLLAAELGVEPGRALRTLHLRILCADPRLDRPPAPVHAVRVDDQWLPWSAGGHPALEFCNTYAGWGSTSPLPGSEWLRHYATLAVWAGHQDLIAPEQVTRLRDRAAVRPGEAAAVLDDARRLRTGLYACLTDPQNGQAFRAVATQVQDAVRSSVFICGEDGLGRWQPSLSSGLRLPLHAVALAAADLLADPRRLTVRACPSPTCGWLFLDVAGRRRWCSLGTCGAGRNAPAPTVSGTA
ncbi:SARP family transcriptional regulator [Streptomyces sp. SBST2-5]|uniref:SARP family transcriptional regulator n=1 Tax=Streptomyces composti TaxID=2720025 RepID=A0ABX1A292_9ACTN|nr:BTAD domain-containing putative transcriptional regulator [Streptomyces composti]NJP49551.1 SARP family transcriptional regulator [Streptomyces composti]